MLKIVKWKRERNTKGINAHQEWVAVFNDGSILEVHSNEDVLGNKWYLTNGEGCGTVWYPTKEAAAESFIRHGRIMTGADSGLCKKCSCSYGGHNPLFKKYRDWACSLWKEKIAKNMAVPMKKRGA